MARNLFHRDFTLIRAALLAGLLGLAAIMGDVPRSGEDMAEEAGVVRYNLIPAVYGLFAGDCGKAWQGTAL